MKKIIINSCLISIILTSIFSCDDALEDYYENPNKTTEANMPMLLTNMLNSTYAVSSYSKYRTYSLPIEAVYTGQFGNFTASNQYTPNTAFTMGRWDGFYSGGVMNSYRAMESSYNEMSDAEQESNYIYLLLAKIFLFDHAAQVVDVWGSIPFTEAGGVNVTNVIQNGAYDDAESIYTTIIDSLDVINEYFISMDQLPLDAITSLSTQDLLNEGDLAAWRIYANSLRLRLLMRISNYDEATAQAKITQMLNDPGQYPLVESNDQNILIDMYPQGTSLYSEGLASAFTELGPYAPAYMLETVMNDHNDPRTDVFWDAGIDGFVGVPQDSSLSAQQKMATDGLLTTYDTATFIYNWNVPGVVITASEVSFLKAEAYQRWGLGDAKGAYETGIEQSIAFYYELNQSSYLSTNFQFSRAVMDSPTADAVQAYLADADIAYSGSSEELMEKIATQKWIHFFILQTEQAWAEIRRTGYPEIVFPVSPSGLSQPPLRFTYPNTEAIYNPDNYQEYAEYDDFDNPIFWDVD